MYEENTGAVTDALKASSTAVFTDDTIAKILELTTKSGDANVRFDTVAPDADGNVTVAAGAEVVYVAVSDTQQTTITPPSNAPVVIFQGAGGVSATFNDGATTVQTAAGTPDRIVVGTAGADKIVIADGKNSQVTIGEGDTVVAGAGNDTIVAGTGDSTVSGGTGHAIVEMTGKTSDYVVTVENGHAIVTNSNGSTTDISKIQFVQLDDGKALVFAKNNAEAAITTLYETTFGRTADANGLKYWFDKAAAGASLTEIATGFAQSSEYQANAGVSNTVFLDELYLNTFARAADESGMAYWTAALNNGTSRADLMASFSQVAANNIDGTSQSEVTIVGSVTIIHDII